MPLQLSRELPVYRDVDVLVCGGGCAGVGAAVAAARRGASTLLVEKLGFTGGFLTAVIGSSFDGLVDLETGEIVVGGVVLEILDGIGGVSWARHGTPIAPSNELREEVESRGKARAILDPERFKRFADQLLASSGVDVLYHTSVVDVIAPAGRVEAVVVGNKSGLTAIRPRVVVDCTGDADVAAWAGAPFVIADTLQPMSTHFRVAGIQPSLALREKCAAAVDAAFRRGELPLYGGPWMATYVPNEVYVNCVRVPGNRCDPAEWSAAEIRGREDAWRIFEIWKREVPDFRDAQFVGTGESGARETRRITGEYTLTLDDVHTTRSFDDAVVKGAWWLDRHANKEVGYHDHGFVKPYDIPYRTLLPGGVENLLVAGRCHSATSEALASTRVTVTAMGMGEAAGVAAALCVQEGTIPRDVDVERLRADLSAPRGLLNPLGSPTRES